MNNIVQSFVLFDLIYVLVGTLMDILMVGHRFKSTPTNIHRSQHPVFPDGHPVQVLTEANVLSVSEFATEYVLVATHCPEV